MKSQVIAAVLVVLPAVAGAQSQGQEPIVQVGLYGYRADGTVGAAAYDTAPELTSTVYMNAQRCLLGAGNRQPPADATDIWQFTGKVISATSEQAVIQLDWRRPLVQGRRVEGSQSSQQLTLRAGDVVQLDQAATEERPGCPTMSVAFEARYVPRLSGMGFPAGGVVGAGGGGGRAIGGGSGSGSGGSVSMTVRPAEGAAGIGSSVGVAQSGAAGVTAVGGRQFDVNLWLVRAVPGRLDEVTHSLLRMNADGASFSFAPVVVMTDGVQSIVQVTGSLAVLRSASGEEQLMFATQRRLSSASSSHEANDAKHDTQGTSRVVNRMPGPEEVLSFEMPPLKVHGRLVAPDQFSVRLKVEPRR